jgi:hypothetical protein
MVREGHGLKGTELRPSWECLQHGWAWLEHLKQKAKGDELWCLIFFFTPDFIRLKRLKKKKAGSLDK